MWASSPVTMGFRDRFISMCSLSDFPVIAYPDGLEVFLCQPTEDFDWEFTQRPTLLALTVAARTLQAPRAPQLEHLPFDLHTLLDWSKVAPQQVGVAVSR